MTARGGASARSTRRVVGERPSEATAAKRPPPAARPGPRRSRARRLDDDQRAELVDEREFLLRSLEDLEREHEAGDLDDTDYQSLHDDYTARAAEVLRTLEGDRLPPPPERTGGSRSWGRIATVVGALVAVAVVAGVLVAISSGRRQPGQSLSGDVGNGAQTSGSGQPANDSTAATRKCISKIAAASGNGPLEALRCFDAVLKKDPKNAEALAYRGWTLVLTFRSAPTNPAVKPLAGQAEANLRRAERLQPKLPDTHAFLAILYASTSRCGEARSELAKLDALGLPKSNQVMQLVDTNLRPQLAKGACPT